MIKEIAKKILLSTGWEIRKVERMPRGSLKGVLENLKQNGFTPATVIDVGAAFGSWSETCAQFFPKAQYLLIEPLKEYAHAIQKSVSRISNAKYLSCAVSKIAEEKNIFIHPDLVGSSFLKENEPHTQHASQSRIIHCKTLNEIIEEQTVPFPLLLKMDIQGAELDALQGARSILPNTEVLILEVSLIECIDDAPPIANVIQSIYQLGFVPYDIFGFNYRPYDHALSQVDIVFVPEASPLRATKWYAREDQRIVMNERFKKQLNKYGIV